MNLTYVQRIHSAHTQCERGWKCFWGQTILLRDFQWEILDPPLPSASLSSSNQKNLFLLSIQLAIHIKAEFALILTAKRLFLNWDWASVQQGSLLCTAPRLRTRQQRGAGKGRWVLASSLHLPLPSFSLLLRF